MYFHLVVIDKNTQINIINQHASRINPAKRYNYNMKSKKGTEHFFLSGIFLKDETFSYEPKRPPKFSFNGPFNLQLKCKDHNPQSQW
jgi:hypothetical protein